MITDKDPTYLLDQLRQAVLLIDSKADLIENLKNHALLFKNEFS